MLVNYGRIGKYLREGKDVACRSCKHIGEEKSETGRLFCPLKRWWVRPEDNCTSFEIKE